MGAKNHTILRFDKVSFEYDHGRPIFDEVSFSLRRGAKVTLMGQNGAGKSSLFRFILGELRPSEGRISLDPGTSVAIARQVVPRAQLDWTVEEFFAQFFSEKQWNLPARIEDVLAIVNLALPPLTKKVGEFSGGQQARLLLASALIQEPDLLLLDEPTNNLDAEGIAHLTQFLVEYDKTCIVISHDAAFLNAFTEGVLYLDVFTHTIEQYTGDYYDVVEEISRRIAKEQSENARLERTIKEKREQANVFANKGGKLRGVAKRMRDLADDLEENKVDVRREDKVLPAFAIECDPPAGPLLEIRSALVMRPDGPLETPVGLTLKKNTHLLVSGPNGIGKSTFLEALAARDPARVSVAEGVEIGYYRQDFSSLDFQKTVKDTLLDASPDKNMETVYATAARFLIPPAFMKNTVESLSEGQKGLLMFARLFLEKPSILVLDEPTNHINFRHVPVIASALNDYKGAMILVSHVEEFVQQIRIDDVLELGA